MSYDPAEGATLDQVRGAVGDTGPIELIPDATYEAVLDRAASVDAATLEIARRLVGIVSAMPTSASSDGDGSVTWGNRLKGLETLVAGLEATLGTAVGTMTVTGQFLTGDVAGVAEW